LAAVDLDDHPQLVACEVRKVRADRRLASKVMLLEGRLPQVLPELSFGFSRIST
jgi:hypothetical protein